MFKQFVISAVLIVCLCNWAYAGGESNESCGDNEIWRCGIPSCEAACTPQDPFCQIARFRCTKGCYCAQGYILTTIGGTCIPEGNCALYS